MKNTLILRLSKKNAFFLFFFAFFFEMLREASDLWQDIRGTLNVQTDVRDKRNAAHPHNEGSCKACPQVGGGIHHIDAEHGFESWEIDTSSLPESNPTPSSGAHPSDLSPSQPVHQLFAQCRNSSSLTQIFT